jgi:SAM-dependent methyltransferase
MPVPPTDPRLLGADALPWQLNMFERSLKKRQKLDALLRFLGDVDGQRCLLVTCGDNTGALNWHFRAHGGRWTWADVGHHGADLAEMAALLGEPVLHVTEGHLPFATGYFDCVVAIDVLEHLDEDQGFLHELRRVLRPGARAIVTVPNGDHGLLANRLRWRLNMTPRVYGHTRAGYTIGQLRDSVSRAGLAPLRDGGYSRFFTELVELGINMGYVFVLSRKHNSASAGGIAPTTSAELNAHGTAFRLYSLAQPLLRFFARLDVLLPGKQWYAVIVECANSPVPV